MDNSNNTFLIVHHIDKNGTPSSYQCEDFNTQELVSITPVASDDANLNSQYIWNNSAADNQISLNYWHLEPLDESKTIVTIDEDELVDHEIKIPNIPILVTCPNCETIFPSQGLYQRHKCEFNADKVVLKADADIKDVDNGMPKRFDCSICNKIFHNKKKLEKHQSSHNENVCEHCKKEFKNKNALRTHQHKVCKNVGHKSRSCRRNITVWKCIKCNQVFATPASANRHTENCVEIMKNNGSMNVKSEEKSKTEPDFVAPNIEQVSAKLLLQCEYCNCTYCDTHLLLAHQKKHTTDVNYECVTCKKTFDSYISAVKHWKTQCADEANLLKMICCEYCKKTFKAHKTLYIHKKLKKHYTPKLHVLKDDNVSNKTVNYANKKGLMEFTRNILTATDVLNGDKEIDNKENENPDKIQEDEVVIKEKEDSKLETAAQDLENQNPKKKKRGRKRKQPEPVTKTESLPVVLDEGYKYQCERCILVFENIHDVEAHPEKDHTTFSCEKCGKVVHSAKALDIHNGTHQNFKPYLCEYCGKSFSQYSHLLQHIRIHQGIRSFVCLYEGCKASYVIHAELRDHIRRTHTRKRSYMCNECNRSFLSGSNYYQHLHIHRKDGKYECNVKNF